MPSYEKNAKSGLWSVRFHENKRHKRLSGFKTKREAQQGYYDYISRPKVKQTEIEVIERPTEEASEDSIKFEELVEEFLLFEKSRIKASSYYDLSKKIADKILPFFSGVCVTEITALNILDWQSTLSHYSYTYQKDLHTHLACIFNYSEKYHDIPNVMRKVDRPRNLGRKKEMLFWTPEEFNKVIAFVDKPEYNVFFKFLYLTGCRRGEALAITWNDINFEKGTVSIDKNVAYKVGEKGKSYHLTTPKNSSSYRTIGLPDNFLAELQEYKKWQKETKDSQDFAFGGTDPLPPTSIERILTKAAEKAGVKRIRIHDLRHSCASYLIHKGISIVAVSRRLGHSSVKQTLDTYSHMMPEDETLILNTLNAI